MLGTVNVFEAVQATRRLVAPVVYASSIAALLAPEEHLEASLTGHPGDDVRHLRADRPLGAAQVYWAENGVSSVGLRPSTVYGVAPRPVPRLGSDPGDAPPRPPASPTRSLQAAAPSSPFLSPARPSPRASRHPRAASIHNLGGSRVGIDDVVATFSAVAPESAGTIDFAEPAPTFPDNMDGGSFAELVAGFVETPLGDGVEATVKELAQTHKPRVPLGAPRS